MSTKVEKEEKEKKDEVNDDDDYMSSVYLEETPLTATTTAFSTSRHRTKPSLKPKAKASSSASTAENLVNPPQFKKLDRSNKGMQLLLKLGYQEGKALGKQEKGLIEPLPIQVHLGRTGIGTHRMIPLSTPLGDNVANGNGNENTQQVNGSDSSSVSNSMAQQHENSTYRAWTNTKFNLKSIVWDVQKCRRMCYQLDTELQSTSFSHFWPLPYQPHSLNLKTGSIEETCSSLSDEEVEIDPPLASLEFEQLDPSSQLDSLLQYLRSTYLYCIYCGCKFSTTTELETECPGVSRESHE